MEELTYQEANDKCEKRKLEVINSRTMTIPQKLKALDEAFWEYTRDVNRIRKKAEAEKKKRKEEQERKKKEEEYEKNGVPKRFY